MAANIISKKLVKNDINQAVLVVVGYENEGTYGYKVYPCIGNTCNNKYRVVVYHSVISRELPAVSGDEAKAMIEDRIARTTVVANKMLGLNTVTWNGKFAGLVADSHETLRNNSPFNAWFCYDGVPESFIVPSISSLIKDHDFNVEFGINIDNNVSVMIHYNNNWQSFDETERDVSVEYIKNENFF